MQPLAPKTRKTLIVIAAALALPALARTSAADAADDVHWATGAAFRNALSREIDIFWSSNPLRPAIGSLSRAQRVAILIDRRVDPSQRLDLKLEGVPLIAVLQQAADQSGLGISQLGAVVYLGPLSAANRLSTVAATLEKDVRRLPATAQRKFLQQKPLAWEDLATPRDLLVQLGQQSGVKLAGLERVPHDLWAAADLPSLSLVDRLTLIAIQFDLTFSVAAEGSRADLVSPPESLPETAGDHRRLVLPQTAPKRYSVEPPASVERTRIKGLAVKQERLGPVLRQLAKQLDLELVLDEPAIRAAGISLDQRVSVNVENTTVDEALRELLKSTGLTFQRRQKVVTITPAK